MSTSTVLSSWTNGFDDTEFVIDLLVMIIIRGMAWVRSSVWASDLGYFIILGGTYFILHRLICVTRSPGPLEGTGRLIRFGLESGKMDPAHNVL